MFVPNDVQQFVNVKYAQVLAKWQTFHFVPHDHLWCLLKSPQVSSKWTEFVPMILRIAQMNIFCKVNPGI